MIYATEQEAVGQIIANGYHDAGDGYYSKRGMTHGWEPYMRVSLCKVQHHRVDPKWNAPDYYTIVYC